MWLYCSACLGELAQALGLCGPELVHPALEVLEMALNGIPFLHQEAVPLRVLLHVLRDLSATDSDRSIQTKHVCRQVCGGGALPNGWTSTEISKTLDGRLPLLLHDTT